MDPQASWNEMLEAISANDMFEAGLRAEGLMDWLDRGGFPPQPLSRVLPVDWDRMICRYVCQKVRQTAQNAGE